MSNIPVAFSYSTADPLYLSQDFRWVPPTSRAFVAPTQGSGQIDQVQGSVVRAGEPGGVTVFAFMPQYSSDAISGMGMLADHTGVLLTLQLQREGVVSVQDRFKVIEARLEALERAVNRWPE